MQLNHCHIGFLCITYFFWGEGGCGGRVIDTLDPSRGGSLARSSGTIGCLTP
jgi:hypothetical protein